MKARTSLFLVAVLGVFIGVGSAPAGEPICPTGTALSFDGVDDYVEVPDAPELSGYGRNLTVEAWAFQTEYSNRPQIISKYLHWNTKDWGLFTDENGLLVFQMEGTECDSGNWYVYSLESILLNKWTHTAFVFDNDNDIVKLYLDGVPTGSRALACDLPDTSAVVWIGGPGPFYYNRYGTHMFSGYIDDIRIWNVARTDEEIWANMHRRLAGDEPGLVAYWDFDEGEGQIAYDLSPYGNHGQLGSTPNPDDSDPAWVQSDAPVGICTPVAIDIKPGSCPNPLNVESKGVFPVAILGGEEFDVNTIDIASIRLAGVEPLRSGYEDVAGPGADSNDCNCIREGPDGFLDLTLKFKTQRIVEAIGDVNDGDVLTLELTGVLFGERPIEGADCILIRGRHKPINRADINKDGVVNAADFAIIAENWLQSSIVWD